MRARLRALLGHRSDVREAEVVDARPHVGEIQVAVDLRRDCRVGVPKHPLHRRSGSGLQGQLTLYPARLGDVLAQVLLDASAQPTWKKSWGDC
jgi:hypothetical protein